MTARSWIETLTGAAVVAVAAGFLWHAQSMTGGPSGGYPLVARFDRADGVAPGTEVRLSGIKVGAVRAVRLDPASFLAEVTFDVAADIKVPEDSVIQAASEGLLGGRFLLIVPGAADATLPPGGRFRFAQGPVDLMDLIGKAMFSASQGAKPADGAAAPK